MTGCLDLISICDMVYFLSLVDHEKFQIIFNLNDVKVMTMNSGNRRELTKKTNSSYYSAEIVTGTPLFAACKSLPDSHVKTMIIDHLTKVGVNPSEKESEELS